MLPNSFIGRRTSPTDGDVSEALGPAKALWDGLVSDLSTEKIINSHEYGCRKAGQMTREPNLKRFSPKKQNGLLNLS
jgi:hypothetical protein